MRLFISCLTALSLFSISNLTSAQTAYLDFGKNGTTGNAGGVQYNDVEVDPQQGGQGEVGLIVNGALSTTSPTPLLDTTNAATGWGFEIDTLNTAGTLDDNGSKWNGPYPSEVSGIEMTALESMFYFNRNKDLQLTVSGLDDNATYNILVYGGHDQVGTATNSIVTGIPLTGTGVDYVNKTMNTWTNSMEVITWDDVAPAGGIISFELDGGSRESWLNFMSIEEVGGGGTGPIVGDYDNSGTVAQGDLDIVLLNWGTANFTGDETKIPGGGPFDGTISQNELDGVLLNWGNTSLGGLGSENVPEPSTLVLVALGGSLVLFRRQKA